MRPSYQVWNGVGAGVAAKVRSPLVSHLVVRTCRRSWSEDLVTGWRVELDAYIGAMKLAYLKYYIFSQLLKH